MNSIRKIIKSILTFWLFSLRIKECYSVRISLVLRDSIPGEQAQNVNTQGNQCPVQFRECVNMYFGYFKEFQENYTSGSVIYVKETGLDKMCKLSESLGQCLENTRDLCHGNTYWGSQRVNYYIALQGYICSHEGRIAFLKTNGSQCGKQDTIDRLQTQCERSAKKAFHKQKEQGKFHQQSYCSYMEKYRQCSVKAVRQVCGLAIEDLISQIDQVMNGERYAYEKTVSGC